MYHPGIWSYLGVMLTMIVLHALILFPLYALYRGAQRIVRLAMKGVRNAHHNQVR